MLPAGKRDSVRRLGRRRASVVGPDDMLCPFTFPLWTAYVVVQMPRRGPPEHAAALARHLEHARALTGFARRGADGRGRPWPYLLGQSDSPRGRVFCAWVRRCRPRAGRRGESAATGRRLEVWIVTANPGRVDQVVDQRPECGDRFCAMAQVDRDLSHCGRDRPLGRIADPESARGKQATGDPHLGHGQPCHVVKHRPE